MLKVFLLLILLLLPACSMFPPYVWIYWDSGFSTLPPFLQRCLQQNRKILQNTRWEIKEVNGSNLPEFLSREEIATMEEVFAGRIAVQGKSDFVRLALLNRFGGVYMDITGYLVEDLNWLNNLQANPHEMFRSSSVEFFGFLNQYEWAMHLLQSEAEFRDDAKMESSFLAAVPNSTFGVAWMERFVRNGRRNKQSGVGNEYMLVITAGRELIREKAEEVRGGWTGYSSYFQAYKLAAINADIGMYYADAFAQFTPAQEPSLKLTAAQLQQDYHFRLRYYHKQSHFGSNFMYNYFQPNPADERRFNRNLYPIYYYFEGLLANFQSIKCLGSLYMLEGSEAYNTFISADNYHRKKVFKTEDLSLLCRHNLSLQQLLFKILFFLLPLILLSSLLLCIRLQPHSPAAVQKQSLTELPSLTKLESFEEPPVAEAVGQGRKLPVWMQRYMQGEAVVLGVWMLIDTVEKVILIKAMMCYSILLGLLVNAVALKLLGIFIRGEAYGKRGLLYHGGLAIFLGCMVFLQRSIIWEIIDSNSFHKTTLMMITSYHNFIARYLLFGFVFFKTCFSIWAITKKPPTENNKHENSNMH